MIQSVEQVYYLNDEGVSVQGTLKATYDDGTALYVPKDQANRHYQEILEWVAAGNTITDPGE
tara:strand:- start:44 stop:229 length:186 start_codon:yes stop_codon:yes gene_type:complete